MFLNVCPLRIPSGPVLRLLHNYSQRLRVLYSPSEPACVGQGSASGLADTKGNFATYLWFRFIDHINHGKFRHSYDLRAPRRQHFHYWLQTLPLCGSVVPAKFSASGIHVIPFQSNTIYDVDIRKKLCASCRVVSGTATFQEASERVTKKLTASVPSTIKIKVVCPPHGISSWRHTLPLRGCVVPAKLSALRNPRHPFS